MYCFKCGKEIEEDLLFCPYCGQRQDLYDEGFETTGNSAIAINRLNLKRICIIAIAILVIGIGIAAYTTLNKSPSMGNSAEITEDENSISQESSDFVVGETYYICYQHGLRVREEPSTDARQINRDELDSEYELYAIEDEDKAYLDYNTPVKCLEMSGNWMRISSGWICCFDDGEVLVSGY